MRCCYIKPCGEEICIVARPLLQLACAGLTGRGSWPGPRVGSRLVHRRGVDLLGVVPGKEGSFQEASRVGSGSVLPVAVCLVNVGILEPLAGWADPARPGARRAQGQDLG